jgi:hypothetical protein
MPGSPEDSKNDIVDAVKGNDLPEQKKTSKEFVDEDTN